MALAWPQFEAKHLHRTMNQTRDRRALQLFEQALDMPRDQVDEFLDASCDNDAQLRAEVLSLLGTQEQADDFLSGPRASDVSIGTGVFDDTRSPYFQSGNSRLEAGAMLANRYSIVDTIGIGGMGEVYQAVDVRLDRHVAIKVLNSAGERNDEMRERFAREMKSVAALSHPNVMTLHDIAEHEEMTFAVMEFVEGKTLREIIAEGLQWQVAIKIAAGIASGLQAAHSQDIMHRDIKPENVIVSDDGIVKILDFGIARRQSPLTDQQLTIGELLSGTIPYMSPEQAEGRELTYATDIFSFGTLLFEMLTGVNPFRAGTALQTLRNVGDAKPPALTGFVSGLPNGVLTLVSSMLWQEPARRPNAAEIAEACSAMEETSVAASPLGTTPTNISRRRVDLTGRAAEVAEIAERFSDHAIVTIVGPGGVGKTSIAMDVARNAMQQFPGGVWICELAPVRKSGDVSEVLSSVLDGNAGSISGLEQVIAKLQGNPTLLVIDNCEHVIDSVAELAETLSSRLPQLTILATSRECMNVSGEFVSRLEGLDCDGVGSHAVSLFVRRATSLAGYKDDPSRRELVQQIVTRLDGLPLAIELAAPRLAAMSLEELLEALDDQISTLRSGRRSQNRLATLERAIEWSFDLLDDDEQAMLLNLSVFAASFTSDAAMEICGLKASGKMLLQRLVEQSVVARSERRGLSRYRLLEPIRQFCHARIDEEALSVARRRHAFHNAKRAEVLGLGISGQHEIEASEALNAEWPDLREAVAWGREHHIVEVAVDPIVALSRSIMFHLRIEAFQWLMEAEPLFLDAFAVRADVNCVLGNGYWVMGVPGRSEECLDRADEIELLSMTSLQRYFLLFSQKRFVEACDSFDQARELAEHSGDVTACRWTSLPLGTCPMSMANPMDPEIDPLLAKGAEFVSTLDWPTGHAWQALANGTVAMTRRDMSAALDYRKEAIEHASSCGNRWIELIARLVVNDAADPNVPPPARLGSSVMNLRSLIDAGEEAHYPLAARNVVIALIACGQIESGVRCSTTAESLVGVGDKDEFTPQYPTTLGEAKATLGEGEFACLRSDGERISVPEIAEMGEQALASIQPSSAS